MFEERSQVKYGKRKCMTGHFSSLEMRLCYTKTHVIITTNYLGEAKSASSILGQRFTHVYKESLSPEPRALQVFSFSSK